MRYPIVSRCLKVAGAALALSASAAIAGPEHTIRPQPGLDAAGVRAARNALIEATHGQIEYDPYTILVQLQTGQMGKAPSIAASVGGIVIKSYDIVPGLVKMSISGRTVAQALHQLNAPGMAGLVVYAEPDYIVHTTATPNDPSFGNLWGLHNTGQTVNGDPGIADADIDAPEAWNVFTGSQSFAVGIIDTGVRYTHADLSANAWANPGEIASNGIDDDGNGFVDDVRGYDFYNNDADPNDDNGHGTHTAGTVGARGNNGVGVVGVNWQCSLVGLKFLSSGGSGSTSDAIDCVNYCRTEGIKVSNNSWGGGGFSSALQTAIENAKSVGHIFVCAAGNSGTNNDTSPFYPSNNNNTNLLSVLATTNNDARASFSNYGQNTVDIGAPGQTIYSTYLSSYAYLDGTSMASPHAAGVVALVYAKNPTWTWSQVYSTVMSTARPVSSLTTRCVSGGIVNAQNAIGGSPNNPPSIVINSPTHLGTYTFGSPISFNSTTTDPEDGNISANVTWTSGLDGLLGTGNFSDTPSIGTHFIDVEVSDSGGLTDYELLIIDVQTSSIPNAPTMVSADENPAGNALVVWLDNSTNETGFTVQRQEKVGSTWTNTTVAGTTGANTTTFNQAVASGAWRYRTKANGSSGDSAYAAWKNLKPAQVTGVSATLSGSNINISWSNVSNIESGYSVQRQQRISGSWTNNTIITTTAPNATAHTDAPGTGQWRYRVRADNSATNGAYSAWSSSVTVP